MRPLVTLFFLVCVTGARSNRSADQTNVRDGNRGLAHDGHQRLGQGHARAEAVKAGSGALAYTLLARRHWE